MSDDRCFACDRPFGRRFMYHRDALTLDGQRVFVGHECHRKIAATTSEGYQPPKGGPRLWIDIYAPSDALKAAGITIIRHS